MSEKSLGRRLLETIGITIVDDSQRRTFSDELIPIDVEPVRFCAFSSGMLLAAMAWKRWMLESNHNSSPGAQRYLLPTDVPFSEFWQCLRNKEIDYIQFLKSTVFFGTKDGSRFVTTMVPGSHAAVFDSLQNANVQHVENLAGDITFGEALAASVSILGILGAIVYFNPSFFGVEDEVENAKGSRGKFVTHKTTTFKDVAGCEGVKSELKQVVEFLNNPTDFDALGATPPRGFLLEGPSGTGKTLIARAVAGEASVPFIYESGASFVEVYVGTGAARVRKLFENARRHAPCVVFIDEFDAIACMRSSHSHNQEYVQTLNQMLVELDGLASHDSQETHPVVVLAATNRSDMIDPAALRSGRFDRIVNVPKPDLNCRLQILDIHSRKLRLDEHAKSSFKHFATISDGLTGADLECVLKTAACAASRKGLKAVTKENIDEAFCIFLTSRNKRSGAASAATQRTKPGDSVGNINFGELVNHLMKEMATNGTNAGVLFKN
eukprot:gene101-390_t